MDTLLSARRRTLLQALAAGALVAACGEAPRVLARAHQFRGETMGSFYNVKIAAVLSPAALQAAREAVEGALTAVDRAMSSHRADSELSRFNAYRSTTPYQLSGDTFEVFALAREVSARTAGAFDVTVAPLVDAWGFGPQREPRLVTPDEVLALERHVGWHKIGLDIRHGTIAKADPGIRADLSGIAKGYGVDKAADALDALGVEHYMIEAGGEVRVRGRNAGGRPWQIAIEQPDAIPQRPRFVVPLSDTSIATSGDYRIYFERDGQRYSHEIDPATGRPMRTGIASISVVAERCAIADALAKLIVLGPQAAYARAVAMGLPAYFIVREPNGSLRDVATPAFAALGGYRYG